MLMLKFIFLFTYKKAAYHAVSNVATAAHPRRGEGLQDENKEKQNEQLTIKILKGEDGWTAS
jgi:hypothetical protein